MGTRRGQSAQHVRADSTDCSQRGAGDERDESGGPIDQAGTSAPRQVLQREDTIARKGGIETEHGHQRQEQDRQQDRQEQRSRGNDGHRPEINFPPFAVCSAALRGQQRNRSANEGDNPAGDVERESRLQVDGPGCGHRFPQAESEDDDQCCHKHLPTRLLLVGRYANRDRISSGQVIGNLARRIPMRDRSGSAGL